MATGSRLLEHRYMDAIAVHGTNTTSTTNHCNQCYTNQSPHVPNAPDFSRSPDDYDDAIGAKQQPAKSSHAANNDGDDASHEQRLRRFGEWLII